MNNLDNDPQVPSFFECPISLEIMKDPVTLSTGITYDHDSIEKWLFSQKNAVCPVTKQMLDSVELIPNLTLHRLIQSWCTVNPSYGVEMLPKPRLSITKPEIIQLLQDLKTPHLRMKSLKRLKTLVFDNDEVNQQLLESVGAVDHLVFIIMAASSSPAGEVTGADEALTILCHLILSPTGVKSLLRKTGDFVEALTHLMQRASFESRANAVMLLKSIFEVTNPMHMHMHVTSLNPKFFTELIRILIDQISPKATKATLDLLINVCSSRRNAIKASEAGAVAVLINTLLNHPEKRVSEMIIMVLDQLCRCAEGRAELLQHRGGLAVVSKKIFRVSSVASESAVRILYSVAKFSGGERGVAAEMMEVGVVGKLCLVMEVDCVKKMKEKAKEMLKMNARVWKGSNCIPYNLGYAYPL